MELRNHAETLTWSDFVVPSCAPLGLGDPNTVTYADKPATDGTRVADQGHGFAADRRVMAIDVVAGTPGPRTWSPPIT